MILFSHKMQQRGNNMKTKNFEDAGLVDKDTNFEYHVRVKNGELSVESVGGIHVEAAVNIFVNAILHVAKAAGYAKKLSDGTKIPRSVQEERKNSVFDLLNNAFSGALRLYAPDIALRPDITEDALKNVRAEENRLIKHTYDRAVADGRIKELNANAGNA